MSHLASDRLVTTIATAATVAAVLATTSPLRAQEFLRGDSNLDGVLSISDAGHISGYQFRTKPPSPCLAAMDANADERVNIADPIWIVNYLFRNGPAPSEPFPEPGPDPFLALPCETWELQGPIPDPVARIEVLDAAAAGGGEGEVSLTVAITTSRPLAGYSCVARIGGDVVGEVREEVLDLSGSFDPDGGFRLARSSTAGRIELAVLNSLEGGREIPAGARVDVLEVTLCLRDGAPAGDYPIEIEGGELVDWETGRAIRPSLGAATLTILDPVAPGAGCGGADCSLPPVCALSPDRLTARFEISGARGRPGSEVEVPFSIRCDAAVQGYAFSVDFDEDALEAIEIRELYAKPDGSDYDLAIFEIDDDRATPGSAGVDEGFLVGAAIFDFQGSCNAIPAKVDVPALAFRFRVRPDAEAITTELRFLDGGQASGAPVTNRISACGSSLQPEMFGSFVFVNGLIDILDEIILFIRGDSNGDRRLDISDPMATLGYAFLGGDPPACFDAADANDDGRVDLSDAVFTLSYLFLGGAAFPAPFPDEGEDPSDDPMRCSTESVEE